MRDLNELFDELEAVIQLPRWFGRNYNALAEVFDWLPEECDTPRAKFQPYDAYILVIANAHRLLADESRSDLAALLSILVESAEKLAEPTDYHDYYSRPGVAFHTVLMYPPEHFEMGSQLITRLTAKHQGSVNVIEPFTDAP